MTDQEKLTLTYRNQLDKAIRLILRKNEVIEDLARRVRELERQLGRGRVQGTSTYPRAAS
jgi:hypothetical protein